MNCLTDLQCNEKVVQYVLYHGHGGGSYVRVMWKKTWPPPYIRTNHISAKKITSGIINLLHNVLVLVLIVFISCYFLYCYFNTSCKLLSVNSFHFLLCTGSWLGLGTNEHGSPELSS